MKTKNLKPFDLEAALNGEPVMLRDGSKAYVRHHETELKATEHSQLLGFVLPACKPVSWTVQGTWRYESGEHIRDIIGMYPKTRIINGFEVPAPETVAPANGFVIYIPSPIDEILYKEDRWASYSIDKIRLERGLVFLNAEDAIANAKAMLCIDPYEESEE